MKKNTRDSEFGRFQPGDGWRRGLLVTAVSLAVLIVGVWVVASPLAKTIINRRLAALAGFTGHVDHVTVSLLPLGGSVDTLVLFERGQERDLPLVHVRHASLAVALGPLLRGQLGGKAWVENAEFNVVSRLAPGESVESREEQGKEIKAETKKEEKEGAPKAENKKEKVQRWQDALQHAFPMEISNLEMKESKVRFVDRTKQPNVDIALEHLHVEASGLGNRPDPQAGPLPVKVDLTAITTGEGKLKVAVQIDPLARQPRFNSTFELRELAMPALNNFLLAYANADVARGTFELYVEVHAENGGYDGYLKPFFKDLDFKTASDKDKNAAQLLAKKTVSAVAAVLKNKDEQKVATKAPFKGNFDSNQVDVWTTIQNLLRNAFLQGLREGLEGQTPSR